MNDIPFFSVCPKTDCPHVNEIKSIEYFADKEINDPCEVCQNKNENWICFTCAKILCSRYVKGHMAEHFTNDSHPIALSFSDMSLWCYKCDSYIISPELKKIMLVFYKKKFNEEPTDVKNIEAKMGGLNIVGEEEENEEEENEEDLGDEEDVGDEKKQHVQEIRSSKIARTSITSKGSLETGKEEEKVFETDKFTYQKLVNKLKSGEFKNIVVMTGAGISVSSGIPDFRSPDGIYNQLKDLNLPFPEAIFHIDYFRENPQPFYKLAQLLDLDKYLPTPTHHFLKLLETKGILLCNYTQNIDGLELKAKLSKDLLVQAHGNVQSAHCTGCDQDVNIDTFKESIKKGEPLYCTECKAVCKPRIIFFGEPLPVEFYLNSPKIEKADLVIVMGTSLKVQPFASLIGAANKNTNRVLINREDTGKFEFKAGIRDLFLEGDCDDIVKKIINDCGWNKDYELLLA